MRGNGRVKLTRDGPATAGEGAISPFGRTRAELTFGGPAPGALIALGLRVHRVALAARQTRFRMSQLARITAPPAERPEPRQPLEMVRTRPHEEPTVALHAGRSSQCVAWRLWSYTIAQQRPASADEAGGDIAGGGGLHPPNGNRERVSPKRRNWGVVTDTIHRHLSICFGGTVARLRPMRNL